jgi:hypothetical protein
VLWRGEEELRSVTNTAFCRRAARPWWAGGTPTAAQGDARLRLHAVRCRQPGNPLIPRVGARVRRFGGCPMYASHFNFFRYIKLNVRRTK